MNINITDKYWMNIADMVANASTCRVKLGTVLINKNELVSVGFVGSIPEDLHCIDVGCLYEIVNGSRTCIRTVHSEMNAILRLNGRLVDTCYTTYEPCLTCFKLLLSIGIKKIIFRRKHDDHWKHNLILNLSSQLNSKLIYQEYNEI